MKSIFSVCSSLLLLIARKANKPSHSQPERRKTSDDNQIISGLSQAIELYQQEAAAKKALLREIEYLYSILINNSGYRYRLHVLPNLPPFLCTTGTKNDKTVFLLYVPSDCQEIASIAVRYIGRTMVIEKIVVSQLVYESKQIGTVLVHQLITEAKALDMHQIMDAEGLAVTPLFTEAARLGEILGLRVGINLLSNLADNLPATDFKSGQ